MNELGKREESLDYRNSHKTKGAEYDETIFSVPYDTYMDRWEGHHLAQILHALFPASIPRYLDFACGTARITQRIESLALESFGVDVSESMLNEARRKCHCTQFVCADITQSDVLPGPFDLVTAFRFFGNAQHELRASVLTAINRRLRQNGYLVINNHRNPYSCLGLTGQIAEGPKEMDLSYFKLRKLLRQHGFEIARQYSIGFWIFRYKLTSAEILESAAAEKRERAFQHSWLVPFSPDSLIVARKIASLHA